MPITCTYNSGVLAFYISGGELGDLITGLRLRFALSLHHKLIEPSDFYLDITPDTASTLQGIMEIERQTMAQLRKALPEWQPGYSNRKIRKGKGHGKG